jgi:hypothetical protein
LLVFQLLLFLAWFAGLLWLPWLQPRSATPYRRVRAPIAHGSWSGDVRSATTGARLAGASIELRIGRDAPVTARPLERVATHAADAFVIGAAPGVYTARIQAPGFEPETRIVTLSSRPLRRDVFLVPGVPVGSLRVCLSWGDAPADLDLHLDTPGVTDGQVHVFWGMRSAGPVSLDRDDVDAHCPETITLPLIRGTYRVHVHDYSDREATDGPGARVLARSEAVIDVYGSSGHLARYTVDPRATGTLWTVLDIEGLHPTLRAIHAFSLEASSGRVADYRDPEWDRPCLKTPRPRRTDGKS